MKQMLFAVMMMVAGWLSAQVEEGTASYYNDNFHGKATASGEKYDKNALTGAHKHLPFGTRVKVTRLDNNRSVIVKINDRGAFTKGMVIDLSRKAAEQIDLTTAGRAMVKLEVINDDAPVVAASAEAPKVEVIKVEPKKDDPKAVAEKGKGKDKKGKDKNAPVTREVANMETAGLYKIQVLKLDNEGFGVQVATYTSYDGVLKQVAVMQDKWFKNVMVYVTGEGEKAQYRIILGPFFDKPTAESYRDNVKKKHKLEGFVVDLKTLKPE